jgi:hypothetical protein
LIAEAGILHRSLTANFARQIAKTIRFTSESPSRPLLADFAARRKSSKFQPDFGPTALELLRNPWLHVCR